MAGRTPEEEVPVPVLRQRWDSLTFLHWRFEASVVQRLLPRGLVVEEVDGSAWVGMTPFVARRTAAGPLPPLPVGATYRETNLRTYVRTPSGLDAVWFFSLEADQPLLVAAARAVLRLPYRWAAMTAEVGPDRCRYRSRRRQGTPVGHDVEVRPGAVLGPGERTPRHELLTGRWRLAVPGTGGRVTVPVRHEPWVLCTAELERLDETLLAAAGLPPPEGPPEVWWSPGVDAVVGPPRKR